VTIAYVTNLTAKYLARHKNNQSFYYFGFEQLISIAQYVLKSVAVQKGEQPKEIRNGHQ